MGDGAWPWGVVQVHTTRRGLRANVMCLSLTLFVLLLLTIPPCKGEISGERMDAGGSDELGDEAIRRKAAQEAANKLVAEIKARKARNTMPPAPPQQDIANAEEGETIHGKKRLARQEQENVKLKAEETVKEKAEQQEEQQESVTERQRQRAAQEAEDRLRAEERERAREARREEEAARERERQREQEREEERLRELDRMRRQEREREEERAREQKEQERLKQEAEQERLAMERPKQEKEGGQEGQERQRQREEEREEERAREPRLEIAQVDIVPHGETKGSAVAVAPLPPGGGGAGASWTDYLQSNNAAVTRDLAAVDMYQGVTQGAEAPGGKSEETVRDVGLRWWTTLEQRVRSVNSRLFQRVKKQVEDHVAQLQQDDDLQDEGAKADDFADHGIKATGTSLAGAEGAMSKGVAVSVGQSQMSQMAALREAADVQGAQGIGTTSEGDIQAARDNDASMTQLEKEQEQEKQRQQEQEAEERRRHREQQALALQREMEIARQRDQERERAREREEAEAKEAARLLAEAEAFLAAEEKARMAALHEQEARYAQEAEAFLAAEEQKRKAADHRQEAQHVLEAARDRGLGGAEDADIQDAAAREQSTAQEAGDVGGRIDEQQERATAEMQTYLRKLGVPAHDTILAKLHEMGVENPGDIQFLDDTSMTELALPQQYVALLRHERARLQKLEL